MLKHFCIECSVLMRRQKAGMGTRHPAPQGHSAHTIQLGTSVERVPSMGVIPVICSQVHPYKGAQLRYPLIGMSRLAGSNKFQKETLSTEFQSNNAGSENFSLFLGGREIIVRLSMY